MPQKQHQSNGIEFTIIAVMFILVLFLSPLTGVWAALDAPWYSPYLVWAIAIFLSWMLQHYLKQNDI